ncbi:MAG: LysM peptidoglycan-binding domain-containing protein, partial [Cytophagales bacterium]|nr:LysM peptidoglycan-binding domain-containing protein [Cytophagales bacterium]
YEALTPEERWQLHRDVLYLLFEKEEPWQEKENDRDYWEQLSWAEKQLIGRLTSQRAEDNWLWPANLEGDPPLEVTLGPSFVSPQPGALSAPCHHSISLHGALLELENHSTLAHAQIWLQNLQGENLKATQSDIEGRFSFLQLPGDQGYQLQVDQPTSELGSEASVAIHQLWLEGFDEELPAIPLGSIFFEFDRDKLSPEAQKHLSELAKVLTAYPHTQLEMNAYTDHLGSSTYNLGLSQRRGQAAYCHLKEMGVEERQMVVKARGELPAGADDQQAPETSRNRRVDFLLLGLEAPQKAKRLSNLGKEPGTWAEISRRFGCEVDQIKALNPGTDTLVRPGQSIRLPPAKSLRALPNTLLLNYTVKTGDTWFSIAEAHHMDAVELIIINDLYSHEPQPGQVIRVRKP